MMIMRKTTKEIWNRYWTHKFEEQRKKEQEQRRKAFGSLGYQAYRQSWRSRRRRSSSARFLIITYFQLFVKRKSEQK